jgi:hypothetical protein
MDAKELEGRRKTMQADDRDRLIAEFRKLGLERPEMWANSQIREGIPQLQRARVLFNLWGSVLDGDDTKWIDALRRRHAMAEKFRSGSGQRVLPHLAIVERMLNAGFSPKELTVFAREMQVATLFQICTTLDGSNGLRPEAAGTHFAIFETDEQGQPLRPIDALHENVSSFNRDAIARAAAARNGGPAGGQ